jgi:hypothetical protein
VSALSEPAIGSGRLQDALARVLAEPELLDQICAGPVHQVGGLMRFGLTADDLAGLAAIDATALRRFRHALQIKRVGMARFLLPVTTGTLVARSSLALVAERFWAAYPPVRSAAPVESSRECVITDFLGFVRGLAPADRPAWLPDLARYEAMRALLRCRPPSRGCPAPAAGASDGRRLAGPDALDAVVCCADGVAFDSFGYDVVTLLHSLARPSGGPEASVRPQQCLVVARRPAGQGVQAWRLGQLAYRLLSECGTAARVSELVGLLTAPVAGRASPAGREQVVGLVRQALRAQILCITESAVAAMEHQ